MVDWFALYKQRSDTGYVAPVSSDPVGMSDVIQPQKSVAGIVYDPSDPVVQGYQGFAESAFGVIRGVGDVSSYNPMFGIGDVVPKPYEQWDQSDFDALAASQEIELLPYKDRLALVDVIRQGGTVDPEVTSSFEIRGGSGGALWGWSEPPRTFGIEVGW